MIIHCWLKLKKHDWIRVKGSPTKQILVYGKARNRKCIRCKRIK